MIKQLTAAAALLTASLVLAQTSTIAPPVDKGFQAYRNTVKIGAVQTTEAACVKVITDWVAADARHSTKPATTAFSCNGQKVYVATTTPPPVCLAEPASSSTNSACGTGFTGSLTTLLTYIKILTATSCTWSQVSTVTGACVPVPPPVAVAWTDLAVEGKTFTITGTSKNVRYGIYNQWVTGQDVWGPTVTFAPGTYTCGAAQYWPTDPKPGSAKLCQLSNEVLAPATPPPVPPAASEPTPQNQGSEFVKINMANAQKLSQNPVGGWDKDMLIPTTEVAPASDIGAFRTGCQAVKFAFDDPIVYPGQPGKSHLHTFLGNTGINASSTAASLSTTGNSTCRGGTINRSSYWVPSMIDTRTGGPMAPMFESNFYYKTGYALPPSAITEVPLGLRMIAGDAKGNPSAPSSAAIYACVWNGGNSNWSSSIPTDCPGGDGSWLIMGIDFPQCWDGVNLDSPDHKSHMTNPVNVKANNTGNCPATHPVALPQIAYQILYQVKVTGETKYWRLSSDAYDNTKPAGFSGHGDYFMAWKPEIVKVWTKNCDNAQKDCHSHLLGDGRAMVIP